MTSKLILGDCLEVMKTIPDGSIDLTVTSPPYDNLRKYNGYVFDFEGIAQQLYRVTKLGGVVVWVVADATINGSETGTSFRQALYFKDIGFNLHDTMIYQTDKPPMNDNRYQAEFEYMFVLSKGKPKSFNPILKKCKKAGERRIGTTYRETSGALKNQWRGGVYGTTSVAGCIWYYPTGGINLGHPAPYPESLAGDHILSWSNPGDTVLDPMTGSGTTGKMAVKYNRNFIGIEIDPQYFAIAQKRVHDAEQQMTLGI